MPASKQLPALPDEETIKEKLNRLDWWMKEPERLDEEIAEMHAMWDEVDAKYGAQSPDPDDEALRKGLGPILTEWYQILNSDRDEDKEPVETKSQEPTTRPIMGSKEIAAKVNGAYDRLMNQAKAAQNYIKTQMVLLNRAMEREKKDAAARKEVMRKLVAKKNQCRSSVDFLNLNK